MYLTRSGQQTKGLHNTQGYTNTCSATGLSGQHIQDAMQQGCTRLQSNIYKVRYNSAGCTSGLDIQRRFIATGIHNIQVIQIKIINGTRKCQKRQSKQDRSRHAMSIIKKQQIRIKSKRPGCISVCSRERDRQSV